MGSVEVNLNLEPWIVKFGVKLYPPIVSDLIDEITRLYIYQQLRDDIGKGTWLRTVRPCI